jgi:hypothetical protein
MRAQSRTEDQWNKHNEVNAFLSLKQKQNEVVIMENLKSNNTQWPLHSGKKDPLGTKDFWQGGGCYGPRCSTYSFIEDGPEKVYTMSHDATRRRSGKYIYVYISSAKGKVQTEVVAQL